MHHDTPTTPEPFEYHTPPPAQHPQSSTDLSTPSIIRLISETIRLVSQTRRPIFLGHRSLLPDPPAHLLRSSLPSPRAHVSSPRPSPAPSEVLRLISTTPRPISRGHRCHRHHLNSLLREPTSHPCDHPAHLPRSSDSSPRAHVASPETPPLLSTTRRPISPDPHTKTRHHPSALPRALPPQAYHKGRLPRGPKHNPAI